MRREEIHLLTVTYIQYVSYVCNVMLCYVCYVIHLVYEIISHVSNSLPSPSAFFLSLPLYPWLQADGPPLVSRDSVQGFILFLLVNPVAIVLALGAFRPWGTFVVGLKLS